MLLIDKYAYFNRLRRIHPVEKMTLALSLLLFSLSVKDTLISLITFTVMSAFILFGAKIPIVYYLRLLLLPGFFLFSGIIPILFSFSSVDTVIQNPIWSASFGNWQIFITNQNRTIATQLIFVVLSSISCLYFLTLTTPIQAILHVLRRLKIPALLLELVELTYRSIFIFIETSQKIYQAQNSRLGYRSGKSWLYSVGLLVSSLFLTLFQRSRELTIAMESRGYQDEITYIEDSYPFSAANWLFVMAIIGSVCLIYLFFGGKYL